MRQRETTLLTAPVLSRQRVRCADLVEEGEAVVAHRKFEHCEFIGPAIIYAPGARFDSCTMPPKPQGHWDPPAGRKIGIYVFAQCEFKNCHFANQIAFVMPEDERDQILEL